jgi:membrane protein DedA with SNARE-associated domain
MEQTCVHDTITLWLSHYGSLALFGLLVLGILALPIPEEPLLVLAGVFIKNGPLLLFPTLMAAFLGSMCGITLSYLLGGWWIATL